MFKPFTFAARLRADEESGGRDGDWIVVLSAPPEDLILDADKDHTRTLLVLVGTVLVSLQLQHLMKASRQRIATQVGTVP